MWGTEREREKKEDDRKRESICSEAHYYWADLLTAVIKEFNLGEEVISTMH